MLNEKRNDNTSKNDLRDDVPLLYSHIPVRLSYEEISPLFNRLDYSLRRYYVDEFFERNLRMLPKSATVLDIGGKKAKKRGQFDIEKCPVNVKYANIDPITNPDYPIQIPMISVDTQINVGVLC
jgi:hypothetical protein